MHKRFKKTITLSLLIGIMLGGAIYWIDTSTAKVNQGPKLSTATVQIGSIIQSVVASGNIVANYQVEANIKASGTVQELPYDFGDLVKKGDLLLKLDPQEEEYNVEKANIGLTISQVKVEQAQQRYIIAQKDIQTIRKRAMAILETAKIEASESRKSEDAQLKQARLQLISSEEKLRKSEQDLLVAREEMLTKRALAESSLQAAADDLKEAKYSSAQKTEAAKLDLLLVREKLEKARQILVLTQNQFKEDKKIASIKLQSAEIKVETARKNSERIKTLFKNNITNKSEYETAKENSVLAELDLKSAEIDADDLKTQEISIQLKQKDIDLAKIDIENANIALKTALLNQKNLEKPSTALRNAQIGIKEIENLKESLKLKVYDVQIAKTQVQLDETALERLQTTETTSMDLINAKIDIEELAAKELALKELEQNVKLAKEQVSLETLALTEALDRLRETKLFAPFDGIVVERHVQLMEQLNVNNDSEIKILTMADISKIYVIASVDESDIGQIKLGQNVIVTLDAYPDREFNGFIDRIAAEGKSSSSVVTFEVKILVQVDDPTLLKPGMTTDVEIIISKAIDVIVVPTDSIYRKNKKQMILVVGKDGLKEERKIKSGISDGLQIAILKGLNEGEKIYLNVSASDGKWRKNEKNDASLIPLGKGAGMGKGKRGQGGGKSEKK
jgi:HlyD family secretion protein